MIPTWVTLLAIGTGPLLSGIAAMYGEYNRRHIRKLAVAVDGQTTALVQATQKGAFTEGHAAAQSEAFDRGDVKGTP